MSDILITHYIGGQLADRPGARQSASPDRAR